MDDHLLERFSKVVDSIYAAALTPDLWPIAVEGVAHLHESPKANFLTPATPADRGGFVFPYGLSQSILATWDANYRDDDVWLQAASHQGRIIEGQVVLNDDLMTREEFTGSRHYREFLKEIDISDSCIAVISDGATAPMLPTVFSVFRGHKDNPFDENNRRLHSLLTPHISRAVGVMFRLRFADLRVASNLAALNRVNVGVLLFGERGQVVFANDAAHSSLTKKSNGLALRAGNPLADSLGWVQAALPADDLVLQRELAAAVTTRTLHVTHFARGVSLHRPPPHSPLLLQLSALPPDNEYAHRERYAAAIGFLSDPDSPLQLDTALLASAYGLTRAECALAQQLLSGDPISQISARLGLSHNTVNSQLDAIFAKTGVHRQAQLVKMLMAFARPNC